MIKNIMSMIRGTSSQGLSLGVIGRLVNRPLLLEPSAAREAFQYVATRRGLTDSISIDDSDRSATATDLRYARRAGKSYHQTGEIAVIPIEGTLVHRFGEIDPQCGMTGYDGIASKLSAAVKDPEVRGILLDINSPGGEVDGCSDLATQIAEANRKKPVWAIADGMCYSAAYWIASQCDQLFVSDTGGVGSVGVVMMHADWSRNLEAEGVSVTLIHAGAHKVDGNPYEPLPAEVRQEYQGEVEGIRLKFAAAVANGRGLTTEDVLETEARCLSASDAVANGFVDGVVPAFEIAQRFQSHLDSSSGSPTTTKQKVSMSNEHTQQRTANRSTPVDADATKVAHKRISAILANDEAKGREDLAQHLALHTDLSADAAVQVLKVAHKRDANSPLARAMQYVGDPQVDADSAQPDSGKHAHRIDPDAIYARRALTAKPPQA